MVAIRILALMILALGFGSSAFAQTTLFPAEQVFSSGANSLVDTTHRACSEAQTANPGQMDGCFDGTGAQCSANPATRCAVARIPAGRCSHGTGSCIWPQGAGFCVDPGGTPLDETQIPCLPDDPNQWSQTTGTYASTLCSAGSGLCDMSTNIPACACQATDPTQANWEGNICSSPPLTEQMSNCSDGDYLAGQYVGEAIPPADTIGSFSTAGCYNISLYGDPGQATLSNCGYQSRQVGQADTPEFQVENRFYRFTPQRKAGSGFSLPTHPIQRVRITTASVIDQVGSGDWAAYGIRRSKNLADSYQPDVSYGAAPTNDSNLDNSIMTYLCDPPRGWMTHQPIRGRCLDDPNTAGDESDIGCVSDATCAALTPPYGPTTCDPTTYLYCHEFGRDSEGFLWTRDLSTAELTAAGVLGQCPPDCGTMMDTTSFEMEAIVNVGSPPETQDPRASVQLALDNLEGPRAGKGDYISVSPVTSITWLTPDPRCYFGGDPYTEGSGACNACADNPAVSCCAPSGLGDSTVDALCPSGPGAAGDAECNVKVGRCSNARTPCDPTVAGACGSGNRCLFCGGTYDDPNTYPDCPTCADALNGNPNAMPVGYNAHGFAELDLDLHNRTSLLNDHPSQVRTPLLFVWTNSATRATFLDNTCNSPPGNDQCQLGQVQAGTGNSGIGSGGSYTTAMTPTFDPGGGPYTASASWGPKDDGNILFSQSVYDVGPGPDGIQGCIGDNSSQPLGVQSPCNEVLGNAAHPGTTGTDDQAVMVDFSVAQNGTAMRSAVIGLWKVSDPYAEKPPIAVVTAVTARDIDLILPPGAQNLDIMVKVGLTYCQIVGDAPDCTRGAYCSERGGDTDGDQICDNDDPCPVYANTFPLVDADGDGIPNECQCGDANGDGFLTSTDAFDCTTCGVNNPSAPTCVPPDLTPYDINLWDTNLDGFCTSTDGFNITNRGGAGTGYLNTCNRRPSGTPPP